MLQVEIGERSGKCGGRGFGQLGCVLYLILDK